MLLYERQTQPEDLPQCAQLVRDDLHDTSPAFPHDLVELWSTLLKERCALSSVVEDRSNNQRRIVGFALSLSVSDEFVREAQTATEPSLPKRLIRELREGKHPWLNLAEIRRANKAEGLNILVLHTLMGVPGLSEEEVAAVRDKMLDSLFVHHRGYKIKNFLREVYGEAERERSLAFGFQELNGYPEYQCEPSQQARRPYLLGFSREEALAPHHEGKYIRELFRYNPPVCSFTPADQELIQLALAGLSESAISKVLGISLDSVRSRWDSVYQHVPYTLEKELFNGQHGQAKSRILLNWLRSQPEEWRPTLYFEGLSLVGDVPK